MFRFTIRDLLWLMVVVGVALIGCDDDEAQKVRVVREGMESVDRHAKEIEKSADSPGPQVGSQDH